ALVVLRRDTVTATVWSMSETNALISCHQLRAASGRSVLEEAWLLAHLHAGGLSLEDLGRRFYRSKSWVSRRLALVGALPAVITEQVRAGQIAPQAAMKYLAPLARDNSRHCEALAAALGGARISVRDVARLYTGYRCADSVGRERIVAAPLLFLRAQAETAGDRPQAATLVRDLALLARIATPAVRPHPGRPRSA